MFLFFSCFVYFSFLGGKVIFIPLWVGWGIHLLLARIWHTFLFERLIIVLWEGGWILDVSKKSFLYISQIYFLLIICNFYMPFTFVLVYVSVFMCLFLHQCVVVQLSLSYGNLNVSLWGLQTIRADSFFKFVSPVIRAKDEFIFFLSRAQPPKGSLSSRQLFVTSLHKNRESIGSKYFNDSKAFIEYSNGMV